jgi:solute carrier family 35 protein F5
VGRKSANYSVEDRSSTSYSRLLEHDEEELDTSGSTVLDPEVRLTLRETSRVSLEFALLWFSANYLVAVCLEYTSVASSTILTSTTSIWTLIFGALVRVEHFTIRKLIGVLASLAGIVLISTVDLSGKDNDENRGNFPHKSQGQIALGDAMAFGSAVMYGIYTVVMKKRVGNEDRVSMPLFFGLVGFFNVLILWPGFLIFHFTGFEKFGLPPTGKVWTVVMVGSVQLPLRKTNLTPGTVKRSIVFHQRLLLGICHAPYFTAGSHSWDIYDHSSLPRRTNSTYRAVFDRMVLGGRLHSPPFIPIHQP